MKVLVVGSGGREHALVRALARSGRVSRLACAPGNAGIHRDAEAVRTGADDVAALALLARDQQFDLTVIGPELPLDRGIVDQFRREGLRILGPSRAAAQLECSKAFAKAFMTRHGIPTARYRVCESAADAHAVVAHGELGLPVVVKADGLAAGKGVVVAATKEDADAAIGAAMEARQFGDAGATVVIEECLDGPEVSFFVVCDGRTAVPLGTAQDHKRIFDDDRGPNTGGMGAFSPSPLADSALEARVMSAIVTPLVLGMQAEGHEYHGFLYVGLMLTCDGPKVIEFNVRFGDPEAQVILPRIESDLLSLLIGAADGRLGEAPIAPRVTPPIAPQIAMSGDVTVGVVLASAGYPGPVTGGVPIEGVDDAARVDGVDVLHSGTSMRENRLVTAGGRVLTVVGRGPTFDVAIDRAYAGVSRISFEGMQYRRDIGRKALRTTKT